MLKTFESLKSLNLSNIWNKLRVFPETIFQTLNKIIDLDLNNNGIENLPNKIFEGFSNLKNLNLKGNILFNLNSKLFLPISKNVENVNITIFSCRPRFDVYYRKLISKSLGLFWK
jgi:Leucine-rich repeat (LRR) protein